ncbi:DUF1707 SHOCT-like domain-containing protein [Nocardioides sp. Soil805]|uniref:DUF1707 SHOCT-like domain-containing protein n=1 Tax=Nocardioides sp. Soil805 TaxID=1736416 RepID=UPI000703A477|nr:DUF1707 domain-containing protein [Nocardioides sp. Soil805]KRF29401.1 hypothetical protein ASG94_20680 [Nocardioides sp. Soil805]
MADPRAAGSRIGDREREAATSILNDHYAAGRIDTKEHAERLDAIWSARTRADLDVVFWDLPRAVAPPRPPAPVRRTTPWRAPLAMFLVAALLLAVALHVPWWVWLIGVVVLLKSRGWGHGHNARHGCHNHGTRARP